MRIPQIIDTLRIVGSRLIRLDFNGIRRLGRINSLFDEDKIVWNFSHMHDLVDTLPLVPDPNSESELPDQTSAIPERYEYGGTTKTLAQHKQDRSVTAFVVIKDGVIRHEDYRLGTKKSDVHVSWSMSKSVTSLLLGALMDKGLVPSNVLEYELSQYVPSLKGSAYEGVTTLQVLQMSSGVAFNEDYLDYHSDINRMGRILGVGGSMDAFAGTLKRQWLPGTFMHYVSVDTHVIGMMMRALTGSAMSDLLQEHILGPLGLEFKGYCLTDQSGEPFILGGLNLSTRDYARIALMVLNKGECSGRRIVSREWIERSTSPSAPPPDPVTATTPDGTLGYGLQWWTPPSAQEGECFGIGIYSQFMYINAKHQVVIAQNAADLDFRRGEGAVAQETLAMFRQIAEQL